MTIRKISKCGSRRRFSEEFKREQVRKYDQGLCTVREIARRYNVSLNAVYKWLNKYSYLESNNLIVVEHKDSQSEGLKAAQKRIKKLENLLGKKEAELEYLKRLIEVAGRDFDIDLKKSIDTRH